MYRNLTKYLIILSLLVVGGLFFRIILDQNRNELTEDQLLSKIFKCPEYYSTEEEMVEAWDRFVNFYYNNYPNTTEEEFYSHRLHFLEKNNCIETLKIWAENERESEEYWAGIERQEAIKSVLGDAKSWSR